MREDGFVFIFSYYIFIIRPKTPQGIALCEPYLMHGRVIFSAVASSSDDRLNFPPQPWSLFFSRSS